MNDAMRAAQARLAKLLEADELTAGMYVRVHGEHLIAGRIEQSGPDQARENSDRVRFTRLALTLSASVCGATQVAGRRLRFAEHSKRP